MKTLLVRRGPAPRRQRCRKLSASVLALLGAFGASRATAQDQLLYSPWTKFCGTENQQGAKEACLTVKEARLETGQFVVGAALIEQKGEARKIFRITLPLGMQVPRGTHILIDQDQPISERYIVCLPNGCMTDFNVDAAFVLRLKAGTTLTLSGVDASNKTTAHVLPLAGFAQAIDGPPTDPKTFEAEQAKLQQPRRWRDDQLIRCDDNVIGATACATKRLGPVRR
jgi:invasion protein IalB